MSTEFALIRKDIEHLYSLKNDELCLLETGEYVNLSRSEYVVVAHRGSYSYILEEYKILLDYLPGNTKVWAIGNIQQGIYTINDLLKETKENSIKF